MLADDEQALSEAFAFDANDTMPLECATRGPLRGPPAAESDAGSVDDLLDQSFRSTMTSSSAADELNSQDVTEYLREQVRHSM